VNRIDECEAPGMVRDQRGSTLIECALGSVLFFMTLFGILEFGQAVWRYNMVANLAQEGARWATVRGSGASGGMTPASAAQVQTFVQSRAVGLNVTAPTPPTSNPSTLNAGDQVVVKVQTTFTPLTTLIPHSTITLSATSKMIMAR
jgi:Flp pilus assembly protein TadG